MRRLLKRIKKRYFALPLLALAAFLAYFRVAYPGFSSGVYDQMRHATLDENRNLYGCVRYWLETMEQLEYDEEAGRYTFDRVDEAALAPLARAKVNYHKGKFEPAIRLLREDIVAAGETEQKVFWLAMAHLRQAEAENCLAHLNGALELPAASPAPPCGCPAGVCSLPLLRPHVKLTHSREATRLFKRLLDRYDGDNRLYRWLLNLSCMTTGGFPDEVPAAYRVGEDFHDAFFGERRREAEARYAHLTFEDRAKELGVDTFHAGRGVAVEDFDMDGYLDIITAGGFEGLRYYHN
ncbi:MAG TPA: hypothetical protein VFE78_10640, partial [Gemmataceae bacterium]|nr:hypothetical protein [Gemmataceae bacterium]